ncbi:hypothetical protein GO003_002980 [Methylicorpusculum oleiharenae]|uniref:hypothetical protein n=1 Tax=Methylicorpusculum oleiharenae TaxID=1338687 RepID=UPI00135B3F46|nr:hypothetical protein [Methylicorpusculum oleiharenae]MCD2449352.1 hypothetical protein [Methylicorpusculum oleiharenae]
MLKSYEAFYENGKLNWLGVPPPVNKVKVLVVVEEHEQVEQGGQSIKRLKGIAPRPVHPVSLEDMENAIQLEGAKR